MEQRKLREAAAAMTAELVTLRHHMALLTSPAPTPHPNGMPPRRTSPNGLGPPPSARIAPDPADLLSAAVSGSLGITKVSSCAAALHGRLSHGVSCWEHAADGCLCQVASRRHSTSQADTLRQQGNKTSLVVLRFQSGRCNAPLRFLPCNRSCMLHIPNIIMR